MRALISYSWISHVRAITLYSWKPRTCTFIVQLDGRIAFWCSCAGRCTPVRSLYGSASHTLPLCMCVAFPAVPFVVHLVTAHGCAHLRTVGYRACVRPRCTIGYCARRTGVCVLCVGPSCEARVRSVVLTIDARGGNYAKILAALVHNWTG